MTDLTAPKFLALDDDDPLVEILVYRIVRRGYDEVISHAWILAAAPYVRAHYANHASASEAGFVDGPIFFATLAELIRTGHEPMIRVRSIVVIGLALNPALPSAASVEASWWVANPVANPPPLTGESITDDQIRALRHGAKLANNAPLVQLCDQALTPQSGVVSAAARRPFCKTSVARLRREARAACAAHINAMEIS